MTIEALKNVLQINGVVGAGGAGFPTYGKLSPQADTILLNCAECEPLLKLHRQLLELRGEEILEIFHEIAQLVGAKEAIIGIKESYTDAIEAITPIVKEYPEMKIHKLGDIYPMGDEVVLIYEATGKVVRPGGLPIEEGVIVFNVETMYNAYLASKQEQAVTSKLVSIVGEVKNPVTLRIPLGTSLKDALALAGGVTQKECACLIGGPMMGFVADSSFVVTKTTNAIVALPKTHSLIQKKKHNTSIDLKRAASSCCQCQSCTDMCPRHALGHPVTPHLFMRAAANRDFRNLEPFIDTMFCVGCGVCEAYACPQSLSPRSLMVEYKNGLRKNGVKAPERKAKNVVKGRAFRQVPEERLRARLGLSKYDIDAPLCDDAVTVKTVNIPLSQHIGAPAQPIVKNGDVVKAGDMIAKPQDGLSVGIHASISGTVTKVSAKSIRITAEKGGN